MHPVLVIAGKDLRLRLRDRSALIIGFVAPLAIAALMSFAFAGTSSFRTTVALVSHDSGPVATAFADLLRSPDVTRVLTVRGYDDEAAARRAVDDHKVDAAAVVPAGFSAAVTSGAPAQLTVVGGPDTGVATSLLAAISESFTAQVNAQRLAIATAIHSGAPESRFPQLTEQALKVTLPTQVVTRAVQSRELKTISYYAPGMGIFFVLFAIGFSARSWFLEKAAGTLDRMAAAPVGLPTLLLGKSLATFGYALASLATMAVGSTLLFGADWGDPVAVAVLCLAIAVSVVALTALVIAVARSERQAEGLASLVTFGLALAGGNFVFLSTSPPALRTLALFTPNGWAMRGFTDLGTGVRGLAAVGQPVLGIAACTAVLTAATLVASRKLAQGKAVSR